MTSFNLNNELFRQVFEFSNQAIIIISPDLLILDLNQKAKQIFSTTPSNSFINKNLQLFCEFSSHIETAINERKEEEFTHFLHTNNNEFKYIKIEIKHVYNNLNDISYTILFLTDISIEVKTNEDIQTYSTAISKSPSSIIITDLKGNIESVNPKFTAITGYTKEDVIGKNPRILNSGLNDPAIYKELWDKVLKGNVWNGIFINKKKNGDFFYEQATISPVKNNDGKIIKLIGIKHDISDFLQLEKDLIASHDTLKNAAKIANLGYFNFNKQRNEFVFSDEIKKIFETEKNFANFNDFIDYIEFSDREPLVNELKLWLKNKQHKNYYQQELRINLPTGKSKYIHIILKTDYDKKGNSNILRGVLLEITDRKEQELKLKNNEEKLKAIFNNSILGIIVTNHQGIITSANKAFLKLVGYQENEVINHSVEKFSNKEDFKNQIKFILQLNNKEIDYFTFDKRYVTKENKQIWTKIHVSRILESNESNPQLLAIIEDISEKKIQEEKIKNYNANISSLIENTSDNIWFIDKDYRIVLINNTFKQSFYLYTNHVLSPGDNIVEYLPQNMKEEWKKRYDRAFANEHFILEDNFLINEEISYFEINFNPVLLDDKVIGVTCFSRIITERKKAEKILKENSDLLKSVIDSIQTGVFLIDPETSNILDINKYSEKIIGHESRRIVGKQINLFIEAILPKICTETILDIETNLKNSNGKLIPILANISPISLNNRCLFLLNFTSISHQKENEENIKHLNRSILNLLSFQNIKSMYKYLGQELNKHITDSIVLVQSIDESNNTSTLEGMYGIEENTYLKGLKLLGSNPVGKTYDLSQKVLESYKVGTLVKLKDGFVEMTKEYFNPILAKAFQKLLKIEYVYLIGVKTNNQLSVGIMIFTRNMKDINNTYFIETLLIQTGTAIHRKLLEKELVTASIKAKEANEAKTRFLANMSHEIRTPMNSVIGFSDLLSQKVTDPKVLSYVQSINKSSHTLLNIINDILDLSKIEAGKSEIKSEFSNLKNVMSDIYSLFKLNCENKGLTLKVNVSNNTPEFVLIDELKFKQILNNLIGNAIKFTEKGEIKIKLKVTIQDNDKCDLILKVKDTGIGISKENLSLIFKPFQQQENQDNRKFGGTGLGLAIVQNLIELMNGEILVNSTINKGSEFIVQIKDIVYSNNAPADLIKPEESPIKFQSSTILIYNPIGVEISWLKNYFSDTAIMLIITTELRETINYCVGKTIHLLINIDNSIDFNSLINFSELYSTNGINKIPSVLLSSSLAQLNEKKLTSLGYYAQIQTPVLQKDLFNVLKMKLKHELNLKHVHQQNLTKVELSNYKNAINEMEDQLGNLWKSFEKNQPMKSVELFSEILVEIGIKNNTQTIIQFGEELKQKVESFDIENMRIMLKKYPNFLDSLKQTIKI